MQIAMIGLGRMGANLVRRLMRSGHSCVVYDRDPDARAALEKEGVTAATDLGAVVAQLESPRTVWVMLPAGEATETAISDLQSFMSAGDTIIDGGNQLSGDKAKIDFMDLVLKCLG